jgi:membrane peptidoglycan carboxypeptidase
MANAYTTFANKGNRPDPTLILQAKVKFGNITYTHTPSLHQVISPESAYLVTSILSDKNARREEFGNLLSTSFPAAVKTGTTENFRDAWTIGYTQSVVTAVWVGNNNAKPIYNLPGSLAAAPIWRRLMESFAKATARKFTKPASIVEASFCDSSSSNSAKKEYFIEGTQPPSRDCGTYSLTGGRVLGEENISPAPTGSLTPPESPTPTPL